MSLPAQIPQRRALRSIETLLLCAMGALTLPAVAQQGTPAPEPSSKQPTASDDSSTEKLIRLLVERKILTEADAAALLKEIHQAPQPPRGPESGQDSGEIRVPYIPENVRKKITEQVEQDVTAKARAENWAQPDSFPDWARRLRFFGDFRFREEADLYNSSNTNTFVNYQAIDSGSPFDISRTDGSTTLPPILNTTNDREQPRFRLRFGVTAQIDDGLATTFRFSSGNTTNPVSTNQTLGSDFNKYTFVIDQAYLDWRPLSVFEAWLGRMPKPFVSTNLVWWDDLSFDGLAARIQTHGPVAPFLTGGVFAVQNTALDFPTTSITKQASHDKWLFAGQAGLDVRFSDTLKSTTAVAFYDFYNIQGKLSDPCVTLTTSDTCDTDDTISAFMQKGNTLFPVRNIVPSANFPNSPMYEFFGLASPFREVDLLTRWDLQLAGPLHLVLTADYVRNIAFDAAKIAALGPVTNLNANNAFAGGGTGYQVQLLAGYPSIEASWQWSVLGGYKHVDSDAVVDAFNDPDFFSVNGVGGTNDKGYFIIGSIGLARRTWLSARWFSGTQVSGPPLAVDTFQLDLNAGF
jgi:hypothetical protein